MNKSNLTKTQEIALHILHGLVVNEGLKHYNANGDLVRTAISLAREFERQCPE